MARQQMTKDEFRTEWMETQEKLANILHTVMALTAKHQELYEGVLSEPAPAYEPHLRWDDEDTPEAA